MARSKFKDTLCWQCKCSTNPAGTNCPWANEGKPVPGWDAIPGKTIQIKLQNNFIKKEQAYIVRNCPLFIKDKEFSTMQDVITEIAKTLKVTEKTVKVHLDKKIIQWEKITGRQMPEWVKQRKK